ADPLHTPKTRKIVARRYDALFLLRRIASIDRLKPIRQKKFLFRWQKCFRSSDDGPQRRRHLKTDEDENEAPYSEMPSARSTEKPAHRSDQPQTETDADYPKKQMQRARENDRVSRLRKNRGPCLVQLMDDAPRKF